MFGRIKSSRNAKNRPRKLGEIYGDNLNSVADVACGLDAQIRMGGQVGMADKDHIMIASMRQREYPVMGVDVPDMAVNAKTIKKLKFGPNERFDVSADGHSYTLDDGKVQYQLPLEWVGGVPRMPRDLFAAESRGSSAEIDTAVIKEVCKDGEKYLKEQGLTMVRGRRISAAAIIVSDENGMSIQAVDEEGEPIGPIRILSRNGTGEPHVSTYPLAYLQNLVATNPKGTLSIDDDFPMVFRWDDPTYEGRLVLAPRICDDDREALAKRECALINHRSAFGSANRRRKHGGRARCSPPRKPLASPRLRLRGWSVRRILKDPPEFQAD